MDKKSKKWIIILTLVCAVCAAAWAAIGHFGGGTVAVISVDGQEYELREGESIVMPARHPHAVYGQEQFKMLLVVVF